MLDQIVSSTNKVSGSIPRTDAKVGRVVGIVCEALQRTASSLQTSYHFAPRTLETIGAFQDVSPKVAEIDRQVQRLTAAREIATDCLSIDHCVDFLHALAGAPIPVPVSGWSKESGPSLLFDQDGYYADIEISDNEIEYYLTSRGGDLTFNIYASEEIKASNPIPQHLLAYLYQMFVRQNANVL